MTTERSYVGACLCGEVQFVVTGEPATMGYCHCDTCRHWSAAPVSAFTLWRPEALQITHGANLIEAYSHSPRTIRKWCSACGGHVLTERPEWDLIELFPATITDFPFRPGVHVHYQMSVLHIADGLPKLKDLPTELGGNGEEIPE